MAASNRIFSSSLLQTSSSFSSRSSLFLSGNQRRLTFPSKQRSNATKRSQKISAVAINDEFVKMVTPRPPVEKPVTFKVRAAVTVRRKVKEGLKETIGNQIDAFSDKIGRSVGLELVSNEINPKTRRAKRSNEAVLRDWFEKKNLKAERVIYMAEFMVDSSFGEPGAITVTNRHLKEFFLESVVVEGFACGPVHFTCQSWVQPTKIHPQKRVFFTNKPYLPIETPGGLRELRQAELKELRGDGKGERKLTDRIYDYDTYNDLGQPDKAFELSRPILGGEQLPYPRRCRTGRPPTYTDSTKESRVDDPNPIYVPRDEAFQEGKQNMLSAGALNALLHTFVPAVVASISPETHDFQGFHDVDNLFKEGIRLKQGYPDHLWRKIPLIGRTSSIQESSEKLLRYDTPHIITKDKFAWQRDDEFARQVLAGINPCSIERLQEFPPVSKLDPEIYGPPESAIKEEHIISQLNGMSVQEALEEDKLFMLDYHDIYLPFVDRINAQDGRKAYGTRTLFFLTPIGTLKPIAIELSLPPATKDCTRAKRVLTPPTNATDNWLWQLAKSHVWSNDAGVHQLVNHWLRTHACLEPFILATHRQLSVMHPIFKLMKPHMRYNLEINALARQILINAGGVIESSFTPGSVAMEMSAAYYKEHYRFDQEGLPADLIRRGMAVEDPTQPHGLRLLIPDYPYATDGLLIWSAIESMVQNYVDHYYPTPSHIQSDTELLSWYTEAIHCGHCDTASSPHWPKLSTPSDLSSILTTLIWLSSAQHAALNFAQYPLGGYIPNRPVLMRRLLPSPSDPDYQLFISDPHKFFLSTLPSLTQTTTFMTVIDTLSTHSSDEEYLGERPEPYTWTGDNEMVDAFHSFSKKVKRIEEEIERRKITRS